MGARCSEPGQVLSCKLCHCRDPEVPASSPSRGSRRARSKEGAVAESSSSKCWVCDKCCKMNDPKFEVCGRCKRGKRPADDDLEGWTDMASPGRGSKAARRQSPASPGRNLASGNPANGRGTNSRLRANKNAAERATESDTLDGGASSSTSPGKRPAISTTRSGETEPKEGERSLNGDESPPTLATSSPNRSSVAGGTMKRLMTESFTAVMGISGKSGDSESSSVPRPSSPTGKLFRALTVRLVGPGPCKFCGGTGELARQKCRDCDGTGSAEANEEKSPKQGKEKENVKKGAVATPAPKDGKDKGEDKEPTTISHGMTMNRRMTFSLGRGMTFTIPTPSIGRTAKPKGRSRTAKEKAPLKDDSKSAGAGKKDIRPDPAVLSVQGLKVDDRVIWVLQSPDLPKGTVGKIEEFLPNGQVSVAFARGKYTLSLREIKPDPLMKLHNATSDNSAEPAIASHLLVDEDAELAAAATKIQGVFKIKAAKREAEARRVEAQKAKEEEAELTTAAAKIQGAFRMKAAKKEAERRRAVVAEEDLASPTRKAPTGFKQKRPKVVDPNAAREQERIEEYLEARSGQANINAKADIDRHEMQTFGQKSKVVCKSGHALKSLGTNKDDGWICAKGLKGGGGCEAGMNDINQSFGIKRYRCDQCKYDLCQYCVKKDEKEGHHLDSPKPSPRPARKQQVQYAAIRKDGVPIASSASPRMSPKRGSDKGSARNSGASAGSPRQGRVGSGRLQAAKGRNP